MDGPIPFALRPPLFAYFAGIDIADRQEVYSRRGQTGRFIGRSGNSWRTGKSNFLSLISDPRGHRGEDQKQIPILNSYPYDWPNIAAERSEAPNAIWFNGRAEVR